MRWAALHLGAEHLLDHIAPLCDYLDMPLLAEDTSLIKKYYPQIQTIRWKDPEKSWGKLAQKMDVLFRCGYWPKHLKKMMLDLFQKEMHFVFCPHGQSDKGLHSSLLDPYAEQELAILYGPLMQEMLGARGKTVRSVIIGNYRLSFYQRYRRFYDQLVQKDVFSFLAHQPTLLYAPTWQDIEESSSFFIFGRRLIEMAPPHWNLIVKPHPLLEDREPGLYHSIVGVAEKKPNVLILERFPPIYPLLQRIDAYLGDGSSVGYDFLFFERPMFFLPSKHPGRLTECGYMLELDHPYDFIKTHLEKMHHFRSRQRALARYAYAGRGNVRKNLLHALRGQDKNDAEIH